MGHLLGDIRYACRALARQPAFTAVAVLTLLLGIGANAAIFSIIKAVLLNSLPYHDSSRLVVLREQSPDGRPDLVAPLTYLDWKSQAHAVSVMAAFRQARFAFAGRGDPIDVAAVRGTPELFTVLGVDAMLGRTFLPEEATPGRERVAVVSAPFWQKHLGGANDIVGRTLRLDAQPYTIVGVMPATFDFPPSGNIDVWTPLVFDAKDQHSRSRRARSLDVVGRLAGDTPADEAQRELEVIAARIAGEYPDSNTGWSARVTPAREHLVTTVRPALLLISAAVAFLLVIACANVTNLVLARLSSRRTEIVVRAALGASRGAIVRQMLAESIVLAGTGGALGLVVAWAAVSMAHRLPEGSLPRMQQIELDGGVVLFAFAVSVAVAIVVGLAPALHATRSGLRDSINAFSGSPGRPAARRVLGTLVVVEVAVALLLLVAAGLMTRSFAHLMRVAPGFEPRNLLAVQVYLPQTKYQNGGQRLRFYTEAVRRLAVVPGVESVSAVSALPMYPVGIDFALPFTIEGRAAPDNGEEPRADIRTAAPGYFATMRIALVKGRAIGEQDRMGAPATMVINETMASRYFAGEDPIGKVVKNPHGRGEIVGVVADVRHYGLDNAPRAEVFMPAWQQPLAGMAIVVRTASDPAAYLDTIRRELLAIDAEQPIRAASTMTDAVARSVFLPRVSMLLLVAFASVALMLAVVGIYGVVSYSVKQRTREIGVRMALGADAHDTLRLVLGRSMLLVGAGTAAGLIGAMLATRVMTGLLYGITPLDPLVFAAVALLVGAAGFLASLVPAWRAMQSDPVVALRVE